MKEAGRQTRWGVTLTIGLVIIASSFGLGLVILARGNTPLAVDASWNVLITDWSVPALTSFSKALDWVGGGWFAFVLVPLAGAAVFVLVQRPWAGAYFVVASVVSASLVQLFKYFFGRTRPDNILILIDSAAYPSGHAANAATIATVLIVVLRRAWAVVVGVAWTFLMVFSRTYLHAHWLSDTLGGALVGCGCALAIAAAFAVPLARENGHAVGRSQSVA